MKLLEVVREFASQFIDAGHDQLEVCTVLKTRILADLLVVLVTGKMHSQDRVVVIRAGEFGCSVRNQYLDELIHV